VQPRAFLASLETFGIKLGLEQIRTLLDALGHPERGFPSISIVGTNGKGSVTAMIERGLRAAGYRTGRYTSPHLVHLEERFAIDGQPVSARSLDDALVEVQAASRSLPHPPTYFEATTAAALLLFARAGAGSRQHVREPSRRQGDHDVTGVDVALLEAGLGGRLDATNAVDAAGVVVTSIDFDHQEHLGESLATIAAEKAAVIKPGSVVVTVPQPPDAAEAVTRRCQMVGATLVQAVPVPQADVTLIDGRARLHLATPRRAYGPLTLGLRGRHQVGNAVAAVLMLEALDERGLFSIDADAIRQAVEDAAWPGRLDLLDVDGVDVLIDGAHNPAGAKALAAYLREVIGRPVPVVLGVMRDKDAAAIVEALAGCANRFVCTAPSSARSMSPADLTALAASVATNLPVDAAASPADAIRAAATSGTPVVVAGSLYLAGEVRALATTPP